MIFRTTRRLRAVSSARYTSVMLRPSLRTMQYLPKVSICTMLRLFHWRCRISRCRQSVMKDGIVLEDRRSAGFDFDPGVQRAARCAVAGNSIANQASFRTSADEHPGARVFVDEVSEKRGARI